MSSRKKKRGTPPSDAAASQLAERPVPHDEGHLLLSFRHMRAGWGVEDLDEKQRSEFLTKWVKRCAFSWKDLQTHGKHGLGYEMLPSRSFHPEVPEHLQEAKYMVFRHNGNLPFVGFKAGDTFYVLWIEKKYGELYKH